MSATQTLHLLIRNEWWLSANGRYHWAVKAKYTMALRRLAAAQARRQGLTPMSGPVLVTAEIGYRSGRADPANTYPTIKPLIDGLVDAGILADDDSAHVVGPDMRRAAETPPQGFHTVTLTLEELS